MAIRRALKKLKILNPVTVASDGQDALEILRGVAGKEKIMPPFLVTLDLNMPRMGGLEFLDEIRSDPDLCKVVVFVLTTSDMPSDITAAYEKNVAGYVLKDNVESSLTDALDMLSTYSRLVVLPELQ